jgi:hypothetical protein
MVEVTTARHRILAGSYRPGVAGKLNAAAFAWTNNTLRVMARNISSATFDLAAATLSVGVTKRRVP